MIDINGEDYVVLRLKTCFYANDAYLYVQDVTRGCMQVGLKIDDPIYSWEDYLADSIFVHMRLGFIEVEE
jgi:hypothetical protein